MANIHNKTETFPIRMTPKLKAAIIKCAKLLDVKPTEWARVALASAVASQCFKPTDPLQEAKVEWFPAQADKGKQ